MEKRFEERYDRRHLSEAFVRALKLGGYLGRWRTLIRRRYHRFKNDALLRKTIKGHKVLIIGSGPSAAELKAIPPNFKVFTCKLGPQLFVDKKFSADIDLYLTTIRALGLHPVIPQMMQSNIFIINDVDYIRTRKAHTQGGPQFMFDEGRDNYFLRTLIKPYKIRDIIGTSTRPYTSNGLRLLQYALYFQAKEIYVIGIDFGQNGYFYGKKDDAWLHPDIDENFFRVMAEKYQNIYSLSRHSPVRKYIPHKSIAQVI